MKKIEGDTRNKWKRSKKGKQGVNNGGDKAANGREDKGVEKLR